MKISQEVRILVKELMDEGGMNYYEAYQIALLQKQNETIKKGFDKICESIDAKSLGFWIP